MNAHRSDITSSARRYSAHVLGAGKRVVMFCHVLGVFEIFPIFRIRRQTRKKGQKRARLQGIRFYVVMFCHVLSLNMTNDLSRQFVMFCHVSPLGDMTNMTVEDDDKK